MSRSGRGFRVMCFFERDVRLRKRGDGEEADEIHGEGSTEPTGVIEFGEHGR